MEPEFDLFKKRIKGVWRQRKNEFPLSYPRPRKQVAVMSSSRPVEAVFKIASYIKTSNEAKSALIYVARNSEGLNQDCDLYDEEKAIVSVPEINNKIQDFDFKNDRKNRLNMVHFIVSFPNRLNVSENEMKKFMERYLEPFAEKQFKYVFAVHTHQSAIHGHVIMSLSNGRERLQFKKPQLLMMRQHQAEIAKEFGWNVQATRFIDRDFSLSGIVIPTKKKTLLERQVPNWYAKRQNENKDALTKEYKIDDATQRILSEWSKGFDNPKRAEQLFTEMYAEKPKTALWYANNRAEVFGENDRAERITLSEKRLNFYFEEKKQTTKQNKKQHDFIEKSGIKTHYLSHC